MTLYFAKKNIRVYLSNSVKKQRQNQLLLKALEMLKSIRSIVKSWTYNRNFVIYSKFIKISL